MSLASVVAEKAKKKLALRGNKSYIGECEHVARKPKFGTGQALKVDDCGDVATARRRVHLAPLRRFGRHRMAYRSVDDSFWVSPKVQQLSLQGKLLYLYLISAGGSSGLIKTIPAAIGPLLALPTGRIEGVLKELEGLGRIVWQPELNFIWVVGQIEHQTIQKEKGLDYYKAIHLKKELEKIPQGKIRQAFIEKYLEQINEVLQTGPRRPIKGTYTPSLRPSDKVKKSESESESESKVKKEKMVGAKTADPTFQEIINHIHQSWEAKHQAKPNWNSKDGANLKTLQTRNPKDLILQAWDFYLATPDYYASKNGQSFQNFCAVFDKTVSRLKKQLAPGTENDLLSASVEKHLIQKSEDL